MDTGFDELSQHGKDELTAEPKSLIGTGPLFLNEESAKFEGEELQESAIKDNSDIETKIGKNELTLRHYLNVSPIHDNLTA